MFAITEEVIQWISVEDDTPDDGILMLVACGHDANDSLDVFEAFLDREKGGWICPNGFEAHCVRYWAELPIGPRVVP